VECPDFDELLRRVRRAAPDILRRTVERMRESSRQ
jgi:hypothetical protein